MVRATDAHRYGAADQYPPAERNARSSIHGEADELTIADPHPHSRTYR